MTGATRSRGAVSIVDWERICDESETTLKGNGDNSNYSPESADNASASDPRTNADDCNNFNSNIGRISTDYLLHFYSQCNNSQSFSGMLSSLIENELINKANSGDRRKVRDAIKDPGVVNDPNLSKLIAKVTSLTNTKSENFRELVGNAFPMDKMTSSSACILGGATLMISGYQKCINGQTTGDKKQIDEGTIAMCGGLVFMAIPLVNILRKL